MIASELKIVRAFILWRPVATLFTKEPTILEEIAYRDTWGKGADSFISMIYERLVLMRDLLAEDGSIYVHCDWRVSGYLRLVLDEIFGKEQIDEYLIYRNRRERPIMVTLGGIFISYSIALELSKARSICRFRLLKAPRVNRLGRSHRYQIRRSYRRSGKRIDGG